MPLCLCVSVIGWLSFAVTTIAGEALYAQSRTAPGPALKLYILDGGTLKERDGVAYGLSREQLPPRDLSDFCVLVLHPRGTLLWDTGLNESVNSTPPTGNPAPGSPRAGDHVETPLTRQLAAIGVKPSDITYLALSHSHWDHTGNVREFVSSTWLAQKAEHDLMFGANPLRNQSDFAGLKNGRTQLIEGDHDVFGDGSVMLLFTPGHTPGHQALMVKLPKTGPVIISGDLYHFPEELTLHPKPAGRNAEQIAASMAKVEGLMKSAGAQLWIQHDVIGYRALRKAPVFYE